MMNKENDNNNTRVVLNYPNTQIFKEYGKPSDPNSEMAKSQFLFIRHGQSNFNAFSKRVKAELSELDLSPKEQVVAEVNYMADFEEYPFLTDAKLNATGV